ncbi:MAG: heparinase II/III family protein [Bacteroidia bacterium]|nr:heparinase II/III family protein [Bacteroidia bacterium]
MKGKQVYVFLSLCLTFIPLFAQIKLYPRYLLSKTYSPALLAEKILPREKWSPWPVYAQRQAWEALDPSFRQIHITLGEAALRYEWPPITASLTLEFIRNGNRANHQNIFLARRQTIADLVLAELIEGKGRFTDQIVNGLWMICEESYWGVPAHLYLQSAGPGLPDVNEPTVDLFAAETGALLAWADYLLGSELDRVSPLIRPRIKAEIKRRVLDVNLTREDFWWMGFQRNEKGINNWTPWINSNWLAMVLLVEADSVRRIQAIHKILRSTDEFINQYPDDGGCDEGPSYWARAAASLFDCLELLYSASGGAINFYDQTLIKNMAKYIYFTHVGGPYFINFADAGAILHPSGDMIYRFGKRIGDPEMKGFGAFVARDQDQLYKPTMGYTLGRRLPELFNRAELIAVPPVQPLPGSVWLPESEVMVARMNPGSAKGLCLAASGGNNGHSHNHNDVGSFMIYLDGYPAFIDVGVETYTRRTFSDDRYSLWTMQSAYHNLPSIGGVMQKDGWKFRAENLSFSEEADKVIFSSEIARAYPPEAGVKSWQRQFTLDRATAEILLEENFQLLRFSEVVLNLMIPDTAIVQMPGRMLIRVPVKEGDRFIALDFDEKIFSPTLEMISVEDPQLGEVWGKRVGRIQLKSKKKLAKEKIMLKFSAMEKP